MTEREWLRSDNPIAMLNFIQHRISGRKLRLIAVVCCQQVLHLFKDQSSSDALRAVESFADGLISRLELQVIYARMREARDHSKQSFWTKPEHLASYYAASAVALATSGKTNAVKESLGQVMKSLRYESHDAENSSELLRHARIEQVSALRCVLGNPFEPIAVDPLWLTPEVVSLAQTLYDDRALDRMSELVATLEHAGCHNAEILNHCRQSEPHFRGCWVVDLILGKK